MEREKLNRVVVLAIAVVVAGVLLWRYAGEKTPDMRSPSVTPLQDIGPKSGTPSDAPAQSDGKGGRSGSMIQSVPFIAQAPFGEWDDEVFQDACEEASMIMAMAWVHGTSLTPEGGKQEIQNITQLENKTFGAFTPDMSIADTARIMQAYYSYDKVEVLQNVSIDDIKKLLADGPLVIAPMNGQALGNPHFTQPGPLEHMLVIIGHDAASHEFVTNDPGTKEGASYRYDENVLYQALREYPTGNHLPIANPAKTVIAVKK